MTLRLKLVMLFNSGALNTVTSLFKKRTKKVADKAWVDNMKVVATDSGERNEVGISGNSWISANGRSWSYG
jgi:hypothetical protein